MEGDGRAAKNVDYKLRQLLSDALMGTSKNQQYT
jgi:hypothetical protein